MIIGDCTLRSALICFFLQDLGWDRQVAATGEAAKRIKETINRQRISPPRSRGRQEILDAAAPLVQASPDQRH
jgi:NADH:ubiquinone reductase (H+-translocating)